jgi:hypothetical protein
VKRGAHSEVGIAIASDGEEVADVSGVIARQRRFVPVRDDVDLVRHSVVRLRAPLSNVLLTGLVVGAVEIGLTGAGWEVVRSTPAPWRCQDSAGSER